VKIKAFAHGLDLAKSGPHRTVGLHMSDLYNRYYEVYDKKRYADKGDPDTTKMEGGLAFETILEPALAERLFGTRPKEQVLRFRWTGDDGPRDVVLYFSPDYVFFIDGESVLGEFKFTWYSSKEAPTHRKFKKWLTQVMLYCHALNINVARLYVLFVNDDYSPPKPALLSWEIRFTDEELAEEWRIIMDNAYSEGLFDGKGRKDIVSQQRSRTGDARKASSGHRKNQRRSRKR
jgi:hypothetical protein